MFDIGWSELLILAVITLIVVGPKDLPVLMRTIGRYAGYVRRQADEFREHVNAAMREAEFESIKSELNSVNADLKRSFEDAQSSIDESRKTLDEEIASAADKAPEKTEVSARVEDAATEEPLKIASNKSEAS